VRLGLGGVDVGIVIEFESSVAGRVPRLHLRQPQIHPPPGHSYPPRMRCNRQRGS